MTSATVHIAATEMPIATALRQKDSGDIASPPFGSNDAGRLYVACKPLGSSLHRDKDIHHGALHGGVTAAGYSVTVPVIGFAIRLMRNRQVDAVLSPFAEGAAAPKAGQVAAAVRQKAPPKRSQVWGMRKRGFPPQQPNSGTRDAVSVTTIRISTCDFWATNKGLLHIQHTVRYTELAPDRFKAFWR